MLRTCMTYRVHLNTALGISENGLNACSTERPLTFLAQATTRFV